MDLSFQLSAISLLVSLIFLCSVWLKGSKCNNAPEPPGAWPVIGHLHLLGGSNKLLHKILGSMVDKCGPAFNIRIGSQRVFVVSSREIAKECFASNDRAVSSRPVTAGAKHIGYNNSMFAFAPYSPHWREMKKIVMVELLANRKLERMKNVQAAEFELGVRKLYKLWIENNRLPVLVELNKWFDDLTINTIVKVVAGKCYGSSMDDQEAKLCRNAIAEVLHLMGIFVALDAFPWLSWLDLGGHEKAMKKTEKDLDSFLSGWLEEHRRRRASGVAKAVEEPDFIDVMLKLQEEGKLSGFAFDEDTNIKSTCLAMIVGAGGTISTTLTWAISLLLNNPSVLRKAQEEIDLIVRKERQVNESDIKNMVYIQAIIKETLRLCPAGPIIPRKLIEDCTIVGYKVLTNTRLLVNVWKIQRDPRYWENPETFKPERFLNSNAGVEFGGQDFELIPFGFGRRSCPGAPFAIHALYLVLSRLLQAFDMANLNEEGVDMSVRPGTTTPKATPLQVLLSPRLSSEVYNA